MYIVKYNCNIQWTKKPISEIIKCSSLKRDLFSKLNRQTIVYTYVFFSCHPWKNISHFQTLWSQIAKVSSCFSGSSNSSVIALSALQTSIKNLTEHSADDRNRTNRIIFKVRIFIYFFTKALVALMFLRMLGKCDSYFHVYGRAFEW